MSKLELKTPPLPTGSKDADGEVVDSCWGFFGGDYAKEEAKTMLEYAIKAAHEAAAKETTEREWASNMDVATHA